MTLSVTAMLEERGRVIAEMRRLLDKGDEFNTEDRSAFDRLQEQASTLKSDADRLAALESAESQAEEAVTDAAVVVSEKLAAMNASELRATEEYRDAFWALMTQNEPMPARFRNIISTDGTVGPAGSSAEPLIPELFLNQVLDRLYEENVMRQLATVRTFTNDINIPLITDHGLAFWTAEGDPITEDDTTFERKVMTAHKMARITRVTNEALNDSMFNLESILAVSFGRAFGRLEEAAMVVSGNGTTQPAPLIGNITNTTSTAIGALAPEDVYAAIHGVLRPYRRNGVFMMNDAIVRMIREFRADGSTGAFLWQPSFQAGEPDRLGGYPLYVSQDMSATADANDVVMVFGDIAMAYWVADRTGRTMQRLVEKYATTDETGWKMTQRVDGKVIMPEAAVQVTIRAV